MADETGKRKNNNGWATIGMGAGIVFGLFTPIIYMVLDIRSELARFRDDIRAELAEHIHQGGHPSVLAQLAAFEVSLREIETQFKWIRELIQKEHEKQDLQTDAIMASMKRDDDREESDIASRASQGERLRMLSAMVDDMETSMKRDLVASTTHEERLKVLERLAFGVEVLRARVGKP